jgi:CRP-like cAMP-binding protein
MPSILRRMATALLAAGCNTLLGGLPRKERDPFLALCEPFEMEPGAVLCDVDTPYRHAYFPSSGLIALVSSLHDRDPLELALIGPEGMLGSTLLLGIGTVPIRALVQAPGAALRIPVAQLRRQLRESPMLQKVLSRYLYMRLVELSLVGGCIRYHRIGQRLARALLLAHDRALDDSFYLTHLHLADMLGVRRSGITIAAGDLQSRKLIGYSRGSITVLDRVGLEAMSCDCYQLLHARQAH